MTQTKHQGLRTAGPDRLKRARKVLLVEIRTHGAACLSRFSMVVEGVSIEDLRQAAEELVTQGHIRRVHGLGETFVRA